MTSRRGTKGNPFEVGEKVRTTYFRGAARERERVGIVEEVSCWKGTMAFRNAQNRYKVRWLSKRTGKPELPDDDPMSYRWLTCRGIESVEDGSD